MDTGLIYVQTYKLDCSNNDYLKSSIEFVYVIRICIYDFHHINMILIWERSSNRFINNMILVLIFLKAYTKFKFRKQFGKLSACLLLRDLRWKWNHSIKTIQSSTVQLTENKRYIILISCLFYRISLNEMSLI